MTTITSIILSVLMGLSQNVAAYTGISNMQCHPALIINLARIIKGLSNTKKVIDGAQKAAETYYKVKIAEDAIDAARSLFDNSENTAQEEDNTPENPQTSASESNYNGQNESNDDLENWHKDFQPDNYTKQDASKTSQKRKQKAGKKASRKNRRKQIDQLPLPEVNNKDEEADFAIVCDEKCTIIY